MVNIFVSSFVYNVQNHFLFIKAQNVITFGVGFEFSKNPIPIRFSHIVMVIDSFRSIFSSSMFILSTSISLLIIRNSCIFMFSSIFSTYKVISNVHKRHIWGLIWLIEIMHHMNKSLKK